MKIRYIATFLLHKRRSIDVNATLRLRVTMHQKKIDIPLPLKIRVDKWDTSMQRVAGATKDALRANVEIGRYRNIIEDIFNKYEVEHKIPTLEDVRIHFLSKLASMSVDRPAEDFYIVFEKFVRSEGINKQWTLATTRKFNAIEAHLQDFDRHMTFERMTEETMQDYMHYLTAQGYKNTTISKDLAYVRWFLRWAAQHGYYHGNAHVTFHPKIKGVSTNTKEIIYLTTEEIKQLETYVFTEDQVALEQVRDVLLFCCFTGLRYSDVAALKKMDVKGDHINVVTKKTNDNLHIELNDHSKAILNKYAGVNLPHGVALPCASNARMNALVKQMGKVCGIDTPTRIVYFKGGNRQEEVYPKYELLTTHVGRRSFVVTALRLGIPTEVIMKWTGHSDYDAMKPYIAIVDELKKIEMERFNSL